MKIALLQIAPCGTLEESLEKGIAACSYPDSVPDCNGRSSVFDGAAYLPELDDSQDMRTLQADGTEGIYLADLNLEQLRRCRENEVHGNAFRRPQNMDRPVRSLLIPLACVTGALFIVTQKDILKSLAVRLCVLGLAVVFVVPCSTCITGIVASDLTAYVDDTIEETEDGADRLNEAAESGAEDETIFETLSNLFQTAIHGVSDLMLHFQNTIRRCMNSVAILILTNCLMPLFTFFVLKWMLGELFQIAIPLPPMRAMKGRHGIGPEPASKPEPELAAAGEKKR